MHRNKSVSVHQFAMVPRSDIPRSSFRMQKTLKTTQDASYLNPIFVEEVLPGDTFNCRMTAFARLATPIFPFMDNVYFETFFFFVPNRLVWANWVKFMGEQKSPGDSISYTIPQMVSPTGGYAITSLQDYMGLPTAGQVTAGLTVSHSSLPLRAYNLIFNEWFRDENLVTAAATTTGDGPDLYTSYFLQKRGKRHDYFTSALPFVQKGTSVSIPLGTTAPIKTNASSTVTGVQSSMKIRIASSGALVGGGITAGYTALGEMGQFGGGGGTVGSGVYPENLYADLTTATAATINQLRQSFQIQKLLERDARGGTRYTELMRAHFGVASPDSRLDRPEYLGGGSTPLAVNAIAQTSATGLTGGTSPAGNLSAFATLTAHGHGFSSSFTEHGYVIGISNIRADLTYQQGLRRHWSRATRYDYYFPVFAMLGEQSILNKEIYVKGDANDNLVFGYQERWAEYRYNPSEITGFMRSTAATTLDPWHLSQKFTALPTLNATFIEESVPISRVIAVPVSGQQFLVDAFFDVKAARPMPLYSVPGLVDHF